MRVSGGSGCWDGDDMFTSQLFEWFACGLVADSHLLDYVSALILQ